MKEAEPRGPIVPGAGCELQVNWVLMAVAVIVGALIEMLFIEWFVIS